MAKPMYVSDLTEDGLALNGERYLGMTVFAYAELDDYGNKFSSHWSTPSKHKEVVRLFSEHDIEPKIELLKDIHNLAVGHLKSTAYDANDNNIALSVIVAMIEKELNS